MTQSKGPEELQQLQEKLMFSLLNEHLKHPHDGLTPARTRVHVAIHVVVETQLQQGEPAITGRTLKRLISRGMQRHKAIHLIGDVVSDEVMGRLSEGEPKPFDLARFEKRLGALKAPENEQDPER
jgi:hypothetical protein